MDLGTIFGLGLTGGLIVYAMVLGGSMVAFLDIPSILLTIFGTFTITLINFPLADYMGMFRVASRAFFTKEENVIDVIAQLIDYATRARREGILSLEGKLDEVEDKFLRDGLRLVIDGVEPDLIKDILQTEVACIDSRHNDNQGLLRYMAEVAPAMGMIGTLIGLVQMLQNLSDPSSIGPSMAVAILTTLYGAVMANVIFIPLANKLKARSSQELIIKEIAIEGIMSIQAGDSPKIMEQKLLSFVSPSIRPAQED